MISGDPQSTRVLFTAMPAAIPPAGDRRDPCGWPPGHQAASIVLTDPPEIVALKRDFRRLDEMEEYLKPLCGAGIELLELQTVRQQKAAIAQTIFGLRSSAAPPA